MTGTQPTSPEELLRTQEEELSGGLQQQFQQVRKHDPLLPWQGSGTILLVEDEPQFMMAAKALIQALGFSVIEASNGQEALELYQLNTEQIIMVVTDLSMPIMGGYTLIRELKLVNPELPVIISSCFGDTPVAARMTGEVAGLLNKPYSLDQLREVLKRVVEGVTP